MINLSPSHARQARDATEPVAIRSAATSVRRTQPHANEASSYSLPVRSSTSGRHDLHVNASAETNPSLKRPRAAASGDDTSVERHSDGSALVVTDAACDLPETWLRQHNVLLLPIRIRFDDRSRPDAGDSAQALSFFRRELPSLGRDAQALALSAAGTQDFVEPHLADHIDHVLEIAQASSRGSGYMNSLVAAQNLMVQHSRSRRQAGVSRPFKMWVIDAATAWSGQGLLVAEAVRALQQGLSVPRVVQHIDGLRKSVHAIAVPGDAAHWQRRHRSDGEAVMSWLSYGFGFGKVLDRTPVIAANGDSLEIVAKLRDIIDAQARAFAIAAEQVRGSLLAPVVCISFAGNTDILNRVPAFQMLADVCQRRQVTLHVSTMSLTNSLTLGAGGLSIAFADERFAP